MYNMWAVPMACGVQDKTDLQENQEHRTMEATEHGITLLYSRVSHILTVT